MLLIIINKVISLIIGVYIVSQKGYIYKCSLYIYILIIQ